MSVKPFLKIAVQVVLLYGIYRVGVWLQVNLSLPLPGSIIGFLLLFSLLSLKLIPVFIIEKGSRFLLKHLTLFFVPVTVGVMQYDYFFQGKGLLLIPAVLVSTVLVMIISAKIFEYVMSKTKYSND
ncbi:CidA/LrgA family protein [Pseudalkalibacillus decolorationis]|uniref:CidA/LrgA family protein n=1 Tax=Pseudalkalibacillus decolorationis TaxID=163879 RepID=UPI002147EF72|nr:CidA/LrgA family protein [Pseudalkalibacillus decolorationis]